MNKKSILQVVSLLGIAAIPQLLYFWLAPEVACGKVIYWFCTAFTMVHLSLCYFLWQTYAVRRAAAFVIVGSSILICALVSCSLFLAIDTAVRTASYALAVIAVLYVVCAGILTAPLLAEPAEQLSSRGGYASYVPEYECDPQPTATEEPYVQSHSYLPAQPSREARASVSLPRTQVCNPPPLPKKR